MYQSYRGCTRKIKEMWVDGLLTGTDFCAAKEPPKRENHAGVEMMHDA